MTNAKNTKRALLSSVLALFLCFAMLLGTTYAWFTDSVTSANNIIKSGNLDIELEYAKVVDGNITEWDTVAGKDNIFDKNALWEPGRVEVVYLKVSNLGSLALKYQLGVNIVNEIGGKNVAGADFKLSDYLVFKVVDLANEPETAYTREQAVAAAGTEKGLKDYNSATTALEVGGTDYVALIVYMPESVSNEANYRGDKIPTITLGINLYATQQMSEKDSFGDNYDEYAGLPWDGESKEDPKADENGVIHVTNAAELVAMMDTTGNSIYSGKTIVLDADINLGGKTVKGIGGDSNFAGVFDGQGHTISNFTVDASNRSYYAGLFNQVSHGGTVKNLTVKGATIIGNSMVGAVASSVDSDATVDNCRAIDCTLIGVKKVGAVVGYSAGSTVTNNYAENCNVYYGEKEGAEILGYENTGSTVNNNTFSNVTVTHGSLVFNAAQLQKALDVATGDTTIIMAADITGDVIVSQKEGVNITIDGQNYNYDGTIYVYGNSRNTGAETLTIKNINFVTTSNVDRDFIHSYGDNRKTEQRYAHNVTIENCTFTNDYDGTVVAARFRQAYNITIKNCEVDGLFSVLWADGGAGMTIDNVTANCDFEGLSFGTNTTVEVKNSNITVTGDYGYGVRVDASVAGTLNVTGNTFTSDASVVLRYATNAYTANLNGNTLNGDIIVTASNYKQGVELTQATGDITVTIDGNIWVANAQGLARVVNEGATEVNLFDGEYDVYGCGGKTLTINGTKDAVIKLYNDGEDGCDYAFGSAGTGVGTYTFNGVTFDTTGNTGNYKGFAYMKGIFNECNFVGAYSLNNANDFVFNRCTFDFKNGYLWTWAANSVTFDGCTFNGNSKTILAHGSASTVININNCTFAATEKGYTGAGDNTAVVEMDPTASNTYTVNFTGENTKTDSYNDWTRVKDDSTGHIVTGLN